MGIGMNIRQAGKEITVDRPKIKDLKAHYKWDGFFLHSDGVLGTCVCMWESRRANQIVRGLRKRGFICIYENHGLGGVWSIKTKD